MHADLPGAARVGAASLDAYRTFSDVVELGGVTVLTVPEVARVPMLNRVVGVCDEETLEAGLAAMPTGTTFYVSIEPDAITPTLEAALAAAGLAPAWDWMRFARFVEAAPVPSTALELRRVESATELSAFAHVVSASFGLPAAVEQRLCDRVDDPWEAWLAYDGDNPVAAAALYLAGEIGYLGLGCTLAEHRGKGGQGALLRQRITRAHERGCFAAVTETGVQFDGRPASSYRNITRAGFQELDVLVNWVGST